MNRYVIVVAGGKGLRMGGEIPKQFLPLQGKPILMHTLEAFKRADEALQLILVLPHEQQAYWAQLCEEYQFRLPHQVVDGGETRFHSVKNGLEKVGEDGWVAVHDGVRPFVSKEVILNSFRLAEKYQAVVPVVDMVDSLRHVTDGKSEAVNRSDYKAVQTPQVFEVHLLKQAYRQEFSSLFTDDASVVEAMGVSVYLTAGNRENIKITTPFDMKVGEVLCPCLI